MEHDHILSLAERFRRATERSKQASADLYQLQQSVQSAETARHAAATREREACNELLDAILGRGV